MNQNRDLTPSIACSESYHKSTSLSEGFLLKTKGIGIFPELVLNQV